MSEESLKQILQAQRAAFNANPNPSWAERKGKLVKLGKAIADNEEKFQQAISDDFGNRSFVETTMAEVTIIHGGIKHALKHTQKWMRAKKAPTALQFKPATNKIIPQPLGVVGIISPWNFSLLLAIMPLVGALGAGNRVMIKPSEYTPRLANLLKSVLGEVFSNSEVYVAVGGVQVAQEFSSLPFDHLLFTGSTNVGRIVAGAAAKNLTPVTLELGGKSPVIIDGSANMKLAVSRITSGKLLNAGQACVAPDYLLMPQYEIDTFSKALIAKAEEFYPKFAGNPDYTSIIADSHYARLQGLLEDAENKGATLQIAGDDDTQVMAKQRRIPLTVVTNTTPDMKIMQEEIFGPLLPIVASETLKNSMNYVQERDRPLALYWFGEDKRKRDQVLKNTISGGVSINETAWHVVQEDIPFGGVGPSGMGGYHGEHGFKTFSHMKGVFFQSKISGGKILYPPYTKKTQKVLSMMKKFM
ncbi:MAG: coniferyl aldehyde dehydrogenase [Robiginitomaculum sp.]|nr:coniferyl aldehyde dehydrogenase [Robiginitomaculum sp.]